MLMTPPRLLAAAAAADELCCRAPPELYRYIGVFLLYTRISILVARASAVRIT